MSWLRATARLLAVGAVLAPHPPVDDALPTQSDLEEARRSSHPPSAVGASEEEGLRFMRGRVESVGPERGRLRVGDALGGRTLAVDVRTLVVTPWGPASFDTVQRGDEVRATFDAAGRVDVLEILPPAREEAPGRPRTLPRIPAGAPNPSTPDPRQDRAPGDVPGNRIPRRAP